ncbi:hypothetical protein I3842_04G176300 [Carya illinoinensis]|uniref:Uncharacterized protein n=1 Tax=Carya illinoinensis TaxID=32201 RepID=A0A922FF44_CARIL|nr:hypothetical protein I3842_04G176300 [Carya illinoinensis]
MLEFRNVISTCELKDLGFRGPRYTWCNKRDNSTVVLERLDRFMGNLCWCNMFERATIFHGFSSYSNHLPLGLDVMGAHLRKRRPKPFRFEAMWVVEEDCTQIIQNTLNQQSNQTCLQDIMSNIAGCASKLQRWNKAKFGKVQFNLQQARQNL